MARAKITLTGCISYTTPRGRVWRRRETRIISDAAEIAYYRNNNEFVITIIPDAEPKAPPKSEDPKAYAASTLGRMSKPELTTLAAARFNTELEAGMRKEDMVAEILKAQEARES